MLSNNQSFMDLFKIVQTKKLNRSVIDTQLSCMSHEK
jgi:hypothetical protein